MHNDKSTQSISVIVPTFNRKQLLPQAIKSIVHQTIPVAEIIVVDDGSTDGTEFIIDDLIRNYNVEIVYLKQENRGPSAARNAGLAAAKSELIAFLDADDEWVSNKLNHQVSVLNGEPHIGAVFCNFNLIDSAGELIESGVHRGMRDKLPSHRTYFELFLAGNYCYGSASGVLLRAELLKDERFDESLRLGEDWELWLRLAKVHNFFRIDAPLVNIRVHTSNLQKQLGANAYNDYLVFAKWQNEIQGDVFAIDSWSKRFSKLYMGLFAGELWAIQCFDMLGHQDRLKIRIFMIDHFSLRKTFSRCLSATLASIGKVLLEVVSELSMKRRFEALSSGD